MTCYIAVVTLILVIYSADSLVSSRNLIRKSKADISTLELVQIIFRHGDRTPIMGSEYPNDPLWNETLWYPYADGLDALTKKGRKQEFKLGKYLRYRYEGFMSNIYSHKEIYALSSDLDRSIMSCLANLAGMWPPNRHDPKSQWNPNLDWQPIPVHTIPAELDNLIHLDVPCPRLDELSTEYRTISPFAFSVNIRNKALYKYLTHYTGREVTDFVTVSELYDTLMIQKAYGLKVPDWVNGVYEQMEALAPLGFDPRVLVPNDEMKRLKAGPLLKYLTKNMDSTPQSKMYLLSGHDITIATLFGALGVFATQYSIPPYASAAILELHRGTRAHNVNERFIRVFYRNETRAHAPPYEFKIPNCDYPCSLKMFKKLFENIAVTDREWKKACVSSRAED